MRGDVANLPVPLRKPGQLSNPHFVVWPLELGLGTLNPRFVHIHEKSTGAHPLDPQKDGVEWWIKRCGGSRSLRTQISYMGIDAYFAEDFWLKYGHDDLLPREHLFRFFFFLKHTPPHRCAHLLSGATGCFEEAWWAMMMRMLWVMMGMYVPFVGCPCVTSVNCNIVRIALTHTHTCDNVIFL